MRKFNSKGCIGKLVVCALVMSFPLCAQAQQAPLGFSAEAALAAGTDSNVLRLVDNEISDTYLQLTPKINIVEEYGKHLFSAQYDGSYSKFVDLDNLDYQNHRVELKGRFEHTSRLNTELMLRYDDKVELPGVNNSLTEEVESFNEYRRKAAKFKIVYGQRKSTGQLVFQFNHAENVFNNNGQEVRNYDFNQIITTFYYRVMPNTRLVFEVSDFDYDYTNENTFFSSSSYQNYLFGLDWRASEQTSILFKIGNQNQDFENPNLSDVSGLAFFADIVWRPNTFTRFQFGASRDTKESSEVNIGNFVSTNITAKVEHDFSPSLAINADITYGQDDIIFSQNRTDRRQDINVKLVYQINRTVDAFIGFKEFSRSSDLSAFEFDSTRLMLGVTTQI